MLLYLRLYCSFQSLVTLVINLITNKKNGKKKCFKNIGVLSSGMLIAGITNALDENRSVDSPKTILLVSGWQDVNIGDIAHTPGLIHVLKTFLPDYKIILWKNPAEKK